ncbi:MAG: RNA polymerase sigma factor [Dysgonomonas sp.]
MEKSEAEALLTRIAEDDSNAFRLFYDIFYPQVYKFASYYIKTPILREEIVSDVFFSIWQNRKKNTKIKDIKAYIYIVTKNKALSYLDSASKLNFSSIEDSPIDLFSQNETPEDVIIDEELSKAVENAINTLPERCKLIFLMAREHGLKYKEIAEILSISEKTVNAQMVLAIRKMTLLLNRFFLFFF